MGREGGGVRPAGEGGEEKPWSQRARQDKESSSTFSISQEGGHHLNHDEDRGKTPWFAAPREGRVGEWGKPFHPPSKKNLPVIMRSLQGEEF